MMMIAGNDRMRSKLLQRIGRFLLCLSMLVAFTSSGHSGASPQPARPATGKGFFLLDVDFETGRITDVHVLKSTGSAKIDATSIAKFKKWRAKPRTCRHIKVPFTYTSESGH
jgi:TonB family protein